MTRFASKHGSLVEGPTGLRSDDPDSPFVSAESFAQLEQMVHALNSEVNLLRNDLQATRNQLQGALNDVNTALNAAIGANQCLASVDAQLRLWISAEHRSLREEMLRSRRVLTEFLSRGSGACSQVPEPDRSLTFAESLRRLEAQAPEAFAAWRPLLNVNATAYEGFPVDSCSVVGHPMAEMFRCFLRPYLQGCVLDIGCGPQSVPSYLAGYPVEQIAGVDPLCPTEPHPFTFVQGVAEHLPWDDAVFDVVIVATSLDHVLLLDRALAEMRRVLKPGGKLVLWMGYIQGSPPYDPYRSGIKPVDPYHLFHCDEPWFLETISPLFTVDESLSINREHSGYNAFLALSPR